jgi:hypothetical protein
MRRRAPTIGFEDMPEYLLAVDVDSPPELKRARADWLEENRLTLVDLMAWRRARDPAAKLRPPARRKWLTPEQIAELDRQREREELRW